MKKQPIYIEYVYEKRVSISLPFNDGVNWYYDLLIQQEVCSLSA